MRRSWPQFFIAILICMGLAACASGRNVRPASNPLSPPDAIGVDDYKGVADYRVGAQDLLEITVFGVPDLGRTARVNANGEVSLPLIGTVKAGGRTVAQLESELARRYSEGYLQRPQMTVFVKEYANQRITVEGSVREPGIYPLTGPTTLVQAIAVAKGLDPLADPAGIVLFRQIDGNKMAAAYNMRELRANRIEDPLLYAGDVIIVEQSGSKTALRLFLEAIPVLGLFTLF